MNNAPSHCRRDLPGCPGYLRGDAPDPAIRWPLLCRARGAEVWIKHENHTPLGAFKIAQRAWRTSATCGIPEPRRRCARRGHARQLWPGGRRSPRGGKASSRSSTFRTATARPRTGRCGRSARRWWSMGMISNRRARKRSDGRKRTGITVSPSFHPWLVEGTATLYHELFSAAPAMDMIYVPIGMGSRDLRRRGRAGGARYLDGDRRRGERARPGPVRRVRTARICYARRRRRGWRMAWPCPRRI